MPYISHLDPANRAEEDVFDYVLWSMKHRMNDKDEVGKYYNQFLDLTKPLLDSCLLDDEECNKLFFYGFHLIDRALLLCRLSRYSDQVGKYFPH